MYNKGLSAMALPALQPYKPKYDFTIYARRPTLSTDRNASASIPVSGGCFLPASFVISVIDDDASVRVATNNLLRSRGYIVHTFASAEEFLGSAHIDET